MYKKPLKQNKKRLLSTFYLYKYSLFLGLFQGLFAIFCFIYKGKDIFALDFDNKKPLNYKGFLNSKECLRDGWLLNIYRLSKRKP